MGKPLGQNLDVVRPWAKPRGIVRSCDKDKTGVLVHQPQEFVKIKGKVRVDRLAAYFHALDEGLYGIERKAGSEANHVVTPGNGQHAHEHVYDFIRAVSHNYAGRVRLPLFGKSPDQTGVASCGVAKHRICVPPQSLLDQIGDAQGIFVACHFHYVLKTVFLADFVNGATRHIGFQGPYLGTDNVFKHLVFLEQNIRQKG